ncbi:Ig-like domain-containing protein [Kitasatospora sp. GP82]|uniref:L,D-transpeptidase n=1 Tax=Kitasatospora sp. GP82 TaxID=3035089 RepID=UPI002475EF86|nr:Ig-like domain-containing protein [Kitasatospora sp. GP82]MDH6128038.1 lipoprotein-anchoring transpeptidase ErfK/SrfK [Kitasatospora sp. GP82]
MKVMRGGLAATVLVLTTAACSAGGGSGASGQATEVAGAPKPTVSAAQISIEPKSGTTDVKPQGVLKVAVAGGRLSKVTVTDQAGKEVAGAISADGAGWVPAAGLSVSSQYRVRAQAADANGLSTQAESTFGTLTPEKEAGPYDNIDNGAEYGVGMIVSLNFHKSVKDTAAVEKAVTFETSDGSKVKGHWFGDSRVDFRPEKFWKPGTKVTAHYRLKSVEVAPGVYGGVDSDQTFTIGRDQRSTVDASEDTMTVVKDGQTVDTIPITAGKRGFDSWNGTMVIEEKAERTRMSSQGVSGVSAAESYDLSDVPHAMRLTDTGTYVHGNSWATDAMGSYNASHGCIGVADARYGNDNSNAGRFFHSSLVGDPVTVVKSKGPEVSPDNGLSGWNVDWKNW